MPTKGNPRHAFRFEPGLWEAFLKAAEQDPLTRVPSVIVRDFVAWYTHKRGAPKPERPPRSPSNG